jgi:hypothetical protein
MFATTGSGGIYRIALQSSLRLELALDHLPCQRVKQKNEESMVNESRRMNSWICHTVLMASVFCTLAMKPDVCSAGPLLDWLSGRTPYYQSQPWHIDHRYPRPALRYPQATNPSQATVAFPTGVSYLQPTVNQAISGNQVAPLIQQAPGYQPPLITQAANTNPQFAYPQGSVPCSDWGSCASNRVMYPPRTAYRSTWVRVPVTRYRPVLGYSATAYGVPATQACNGYEWRLRRVPVTTLRPFSTFWADLFGPQPRVTYFGTPCVIYGTAIPQTAPQGVPYYSVQPGATLGTIPTVPSNTMPFDLSPTHPSTGSGSVPADSAPRLNKIPDDTRSMNNPAQSNSALQANARAKLDERTFGEPSTTRTGRGSFFNVTPIRDPKAKEEHGPVDEALKLQGPGHHTAKNDSNRRAPALGVVPVRWDSVQQIDSRPTQPSPKNAPSTAPRRVRQFFDDGGWHSTR